MDTMNNVDQPPVKKQKIEQYLAEKVNKYKRKYLDEKTKTQILQNEHNSKLDQLQKIINVKNFRECMMKAKKEKLKGIIIKQKIEINELKNQIKGGSIKVEKEDKLYYDSESSNIQIKKEHILISNRMDAYGNQDNDDDDDDDDDVVHNTISLMVN